MIWLGRLTGDLEPVPAELLTPDYRLMPLEWADFPDGLFGNRCRARKERGRWRGAHFGRCELVAGHAGWHALERGMEGPRWSTEWTA